MRCLAAYTIPAPAYPSYINALEQSDGTVHVTIRNEPYSTDVRGDFPGEIAVVKLTRDEAIAFFRGALAQLGAEDQR